MLSVRNVAKELNIQPDQLLQESLRLYLYQHLKKVETELFHYAQKYGIKTVSEFDEKLQQGLLKEEDILDDFFVFDHLEHERERLHRLLASS